MSIQLKIKIKTLINFNSEKYPNGTESRKATLAAPGITTMLLKPNEISVLVLDSGVRKYCYTNL